MDPTTSPRILGRAADEQSAERELLEQAVEGSVEALSDILALAAPVVFGRANRARILAGLCARQLGLADVRQVEVAALLVHLGSVTLPPETLRRMQADERLDEAERGMVERVPEVSIRIVEHIPRLEGVVAMMRRLVCCACEAEAGLPAERSPDAETIATGACILKVATECVRLDHQGRTPEQVLARLRERHPCPACLHVLEALACVLRSGSPETSEAAVPLFRQSQNVPLTATRKCPLR